MAKVIVITNRKGGCGKSFTAANLGFGLARYGKKVLCVDTDNQHSLTVSMGVKEPDNLPVTIAAVITGIEQLALAAADSAIIPVTPKYLDAKGLELLLKSIADIREFINPNLDICGILLTMVDKRTNFSRQIIEMIEQAYGSEIRIFAEQIPHSVRAAETSVTGKSIFAHDPNGRVASAYDSFTKEVLYNA